MNASAPFEHLGKNIVVVLSLLAAGFFAAWLRFSPHLGSTGEFTDGVRQYDGAAQEPIRYAVWQAAERLAGALIDGEGEHRPALSADGRWLVFVSGERGTNSELWISELVNGAAQEPRAVFELNSSFDELSPAFSAGELYFASNRPGQGGFDLWRASLNSMGEFSAPQPLDNSINTGRDEIDPAPLPEGAGLAFSSNRNMSGRSGHDFYLALPRPPGEQAVAVERGLEAQQGLDGERGAKSERQAPGAYLVEPLDALNSWQDDRELCFTKDGRRAFFASNRDSSKSPTEPDYDLYASLKDHGTWLTPQAIQGLNTAAHERGPAPNHNGLELIFERQGSRGEGRTPLAADLFQASTLEIFQRPGPRVGWLDLLILIALLVLALLAVLAKRWDAIEVLYKCFLVSLIVHGALLYWFRDIHPESELQEIPKSSPAYQVKLIPSNSAQAASAERGGALELERQATAKPAASNPQRLAGPAKDANAASAPSPSRLARAASPQVASAAQEVHWERSENAASQSAEPLADAPRVQRKALDRRAEPATQTALALQAVAQHANQANSSEAHAPARHAVQIQQTTSAAPTSKRLAKEGPRPVIDRDPVASTTIEPRDVQLDSIATLDDLRAPASESPNAASKRSLSQTSAGEALPAASDMQLPGRRSSPSDADDLQRLAVPTGLASSQHVQPGTLVMEAQVAARETALDLPTATLTFDAQPAALGSLPDVPMAMADSPATPRRRRALTSSQDDPQAGAGPSPARFGKRRQTTERAAPSKHTLLAAASPAAPIAPTPTPARVAPDQPLAPTPLPEPAVARFEHTPYRSRFGPAKARALQEHGGSIETEAAVAAGLAYLASMQGRDGSWGPASARSEKYGEVRVGKTGLCLLAFLGAGHTADSGTEHSRVSSRAIEFLLSTQGRRTGHFGATSSYGHGIATYALAECYALTKAAELEAPLRRAVKEILRHQHDDRRDERRFGGWGYYGDQLQRQDNWPRASITAWQVMALESARLAGLQVPDVAFADAKTFLLGCLDQRRGAFRYSHDPSRLNGAYAILPGSTPASLFALSLLEADLETPHFERAWQFLAERAPEDYSYAGDDAFVYEAHGNLYFWYYASLASMRRGGSTWKRWNANLQETLLPSQRADGSWKPISTYARNYAGDNSKDASYSTAMNVLSLEVYYRYFTPLLKVSQGPGSSVSGTNR